MKKKIVTISFKLLWFIKITDKNIKRKNKQLHRNYCSNYDLFMKTI